MKKFLMILVVLMLTASAGAETYPETAKVVDVDYTTDLVTVETYTGFTFVFEGCEDWLEGDGVSLLMDDNGTEFIVDDAILKAEYTAWTLRK